MAQPTSIILTPPPYQSPVVNAKGFLTEAWIKWFQQLYLRVGALQAIPNASLTNSSGSQNLVNMFVGSANTTVYTSPTGISTSIDSFSAKNNDVVAHSISIYLVPVGGTPSSTNKVLSSLSILAGASTSIPVVVGQTLGTGAQIVCTSDVSGAISVTATGRQTS